MNLIPLIAIVILFATTVVLVLLLIGEKKLISKVLTDISNRVAPENTYSKRIESLLSAYKERNLFREKTYEEAQANANESERGSTRLSRNIQKALIYSSDISVEAEKNKNVSSVLFQNVSEGSAAVEEINASIRSLKDQVNIQNDAVSHTSASVEEINNSLKGVAELISHRKKDTEELVTITNKGSEMVQKSAEVMNKVQDQVTNALSHHGN